MPVDDFLVEDYTLFREIFLFEKSDSLDQNPSPRATGEVEKMASQYNEKIAKSLANVANRLKRHIEHYYDVETTERPTDFKEGGAYIINLHPKNTIFKKPVQMTIEIYDNNKIAIEVPEEISELLRTESRIKYKGSSAFKNIKRDLRQIFKTIAAG